MAYDIVFRNNPAPVFVSQLGLGKMLVAGNGTTADLYPMPNGPDGFTVECLVRLFHVSGPQTMLTMPGIFSIRTSNSGRPFVLFGAQEKDVYTNSGKWIADGQMHHVAFTYHPVAGLVLFVDGTKEGTYDGQYINPLPSYTGELNFMSYDGKGGFAWTGGLAEVAISSGVKWTASFNPTYAPTPANAPGLRDVWRFDGNGTANTPAVSDIAENLVLYPANHPAILYSPYNWLVTNTNAKSNNPNADFEFLFSGGVCTLITDNSNGSSSSSFSYRIDGGEWKTRALYFNEHPLEVDTFFSVAQDYHYCEVVFAQHSENLNRWFPQDTAMQFIGVKLQAGAIIRKPVQLADETLFFADSIGEGEHVLGVNIGSARDGFAYHLGRHLGTRMGVVGFGKQGYSSFGWGGVPPLPEAFKYMWEGQLRSFAQEPKLIINAHATNDQGDITTQAISVFNQQLALTTSCLIIALQPLNGSHENDLKAAVAGCNDPSRVAYVSTAGIWTAADSIDGLHPLAYAHVKLISAAVANRIKAAIANMATPTTPTIPTGSLPPGKSQFIMRGTASVPLSAHPGLTKVYRLVPGQEWEFGTPGGPGSQQVNTLEPGGHYYAINSTSAAISVVGAQL